MSWTNSLSRNTNKEGIKKGDRVRYIGSTFHTSFSYDLQCFNSIFTVIAVDNNIGTVYINSVNNEERSEAKFDLYKIRYWKVGFEDVEKIGMFDDFIVKLDGMFDE